MASIISVILETVVFIPNITGMRDLAHFAADFVTCDITENSKGGTDSHGLIYESIIFFYKWVEMGVVMTVLLCSVPATRGIQWITMLINHFYEVVVYQMNFI